MKILEHIFFRINRQNIAIIVPYLWLLVFFLLPFLLVFSISFGEATNAIPPYISPIRIIESGGLLINPTLENFKLLTQDSIYINSFLSSIKIAFLSTIFTLIIAYPIAYSITKIAKEYRQLILVIISIPFWTSILIRIYSWIILFKTNGIINNILSYIGIIDEPLNILYTEFAVIIGIVYSYLPFMLMPLFNSLNKIDPLLHQAAADLGARPLSIFFNITFPLSKPGIITGSLLVFIPAIGEFMIPDLLGGSEIITIGKVIWNEFFLNRDWSVASAITIVMTMMFAVPIAILQNFIGRKNDHEK